MYGRGNDIKSNLKSKRIKFDMQHTLVSTSFMRELRENNKTKKVYDVDPYVEVYEFRDGFYGLFTENCDGAADVWMYLIVGSEKAMLIDTGYGLGDTRALVNEIAGGKEVIVVNTHDHYDHAYGNCRFDKVYCHEHLVPYLENQHAHMWDYLFDAWGQNIWLEFDRKDLPEFRKYEIVGVPDGYTWDLGDGHEIELIFQGGHAAGHAAYLDKKNRILFPGDNICSDVSHGGGVGCTYGMPGPYGDNTRLENYKERVKVLVDRMDEYDYLYPQHFMVKIENFLVKNLLDTLEEISADPSCYDYKVEAYGKMRDFKRVRYFKYIKGFSVLCYTCEEEL